MRIFFSARIWNFLKKWHLINKKAGKNAILIEANTNKMPTQKAGN